MHCPKLILGHQLKLVMHYFLQVFGPPRHAPHQERGEEVNANCLIKGCEEQGSVGNNLLDILPFGLQAEGEAGVHHLGVPLSNNAEGLHRHNSILHQLC
jgi:hypothetical protein